MRWTRLSLTIFSVPFVCRLAVAAETRDAETNEYAAAGTGFQLGIRVSTQVPSGSLGGGSSFSDLFGPRLHVAFDIGSKLNPYFFFGGYIGGSYGLQGGAFGSVCSATDSYGNGVTCSAESLDGGFVAIVTFLPSDRVDPWLGLTAGYELQGMSYAGATGLFSGISPSALGGIDFRVRNGEHKGILSIGPYGGVTAQKYLTGSTGGSSLDTSGEPFHAWIHFGLRLTFPS